MKKLLKLLAFVMPFLAVSCVESLVEPETEPAGEDKVTLTLHTAPETKTMLVDDRYVRWEEGDIIIVNDASYVIRLDENNPEIAYVDDVTAADTYVAWYNAVFYPRQQDGLALFMSDEQVWSEGSFSRYMNPMVAKGTDTKLYFYNAAGLLKLGLSGNVTVSELVLTGNNYEYLSGYFLVSNESLEILNTSFDGLENGPWKKNIFTKVTMPNGLQLSGEPKYVYVVVPPQTYENGITVTVIDTDGKAHSQKTSKSLVAKRSEITEMEAFDFGTGTALAVRGIVPGQTKLDFVLSGPEDAVVSYIAVGKDVWEKAYDPNTGEAFDSEQAKAEYYITNFGYSSVLAGGEVSMVLDVSVNANGNYAKLSASGDYKLITSYIGAAGNAVITDFRTPDPLGEAPEIRTVTHVMGDLVYVDFFVSETAVTVRSVYDLKSTCDDFLNNRGYTASSLVNDYGRTLPEEELALAKSESGNSYVFANLMEETEYSTFISAINATGAETVVRVDFMTGISSLAKLKDKIKAGETAYTIYMKEAIVSYVNGNNVYIEDTTGAMHIYMQNHGLAVGDQISGKVTGSCSMYNGTPQLTSMDLTEAARVAGATPPSTELTIAELLADYDRYVGCRIILWGVTVENGVSGADDREGIFSQDGSYINLYSKNPSIEIPDLCKGNTMVYPSYYGTTPQLCIWEQADFYQTVTPPQPPVEEDPDEEGLQKIVGPSADWYEIPVTINPSPDWKYISHYTTTISSKKRVRNYTSCYDIRRKNPMWVASAHHSCYREGGGRTSPDPWRPDPCLAEKNQSVIYYSDWQNWPNMGQGSFYWSAYSYTPGKYYTKGHLLRSHDRPGAGKEINIQTFYPTNISPELQLHPNIWTMVENSLTDYWTCSDTTYVVTGNYYGDDSYTAVDASDNGKQTDRSKICIVPVARWRVVLRTKSGGTGKSISQCSADELKAIGFWFPQKLDKTAQSDADIKDYTYSVAEIEQMIGGDFKFFPHAPAGVTERYDLSLWPLKN